MARHFRRYIRLLAMAGAMGSASSVVLASSIDSQQIERVIASRRGVLRQCYERSLVKNPSLSGKVVVQFAIEANGTVSRAKTLPASTVRDAATTECILRTFRSLRFPTSAPGPAAIVTYPLYFRTEVQEGSAPRPATTTSAGTLQ